MDNSKLFLKAIFNNYWIKVEYKNKNGEITKFMMGINYINPFKKYFSCDVFNMNLNDTVKNDYIILYDYILNAQLCEESYHKTPDELKEHIINNKEEYAFLNPNISSEDLLDYYIDCFKMDTTPYESKYQLVEGIDVDVLLSNNSFQLSQTQFNKLVNELLYKKDKNNDINIQRYLVVNELSIKTSKGLYVLAYRNVRLDIALKSLIADNDIIINKEFQFDTNTNSVKKTESIYKYLPEESYSLLDDFSKNINEIIRIIHEYNDTRNATYFSEVKVDSRPFFICLERQFSIDIYTEMNKIKKLIKGEDIPLPIKTFFNENESRLIRRKNYPIFTINDSYNIDQINAIRIGMKYPVSYIQGPPGTGKTKTLLNAIFTAIFNSHSVLVVSNNNIPLDGIYQDICKLKYDDITPLMFPSIRLGSNEMLYKALFKINSLYHQVKDLKVNNIDIASIIKKRNNSTKDLVDLLDKYDQLTSLKERENSLLICKNNCKNEAFSIVINAQIESVKESIEKIGMINLSDIKKYLDEDYQQLYSAIHFETIKKIKSISQEKNKKLYDIIIDVDDTNIDNKIKDFKKYLSDDENLKRFISIFPVIITTNLSCTYLGSCGKIFDIAMMDEAGQCNVANALIPIAKANKLMLFGDPQQLKPVILLDENVNKKLRRKYHVPDEYDYIENSIYTTYTKVDTISHETLLRTHYRCHDKIIDFSNKKYYNNKLILKSNSKETHPLVFYNTALEDKQKTNKKNISEVEAKAIIRYIKSHKDEKIGIITPFVHQRQCIESYLKKEEITDVSIGTVHSFQGDQKDVIIFSSAISNNTQKSTYNWLKNNKELINVAISRAKNKFILLGNKNKVNEFSSSKNDMKELFDYVFSNGQSFVSNVSIKSLALGTRHMSTESEKDLFDTITHILSVINNNCYVKSEVAISSIFTSDNNDSSLFYKQRFDLVLFEKGYDHDVILLAIEENGPEHYSDDEVKNRDERKKEFCKKHNLKLLSIPRDCARDYQMIKSALLEMIDVR
ncbi:MAG: AAA domain-containing protein [Erysipelotrichaceae bacterium]|nr:AAA domain-containing protein [Erysipelotrichaceae bacterium]